jgi:hypothetical protein
MLLGPANSVPSRPGHSCAGEPQLVTAAGEKERCRVRRTASLALCL